MLSMNLCIYGPLTWRVLVYSYQIFSLETIFKEKLMRIGRSGARPPYEGGCAGGGARGVDLVRPPLSRRAAHNERRP
ncbi:hypothetical protein EVAR_11989_1 [Eumeta japonica]|uniref:Uncharacterized protein n=1 Tax=Eumeta variegata TaxID=151549 RepID=A0A4C1U547_EUMVA|nr:hypothetical protein EVAR_11989_1 [Eumeta japonica]